MIGYVIGGGAGVGKSTVARALASELDAGWLQLDSIWLALLVSAEPGSQRARILDVPAAVRSGRRDGAALLEQHIAAAALVEQVLPAVFALEGSVHERLVVDGAWLTPGGVARLAGEGIELRTAYLLESDATGVQAALDRRAGPGRSPRPSDAVHAQLAHDYGQWLAAQALERGMPVLPARPYATAVSRILAALGGLSG